MFRRRREFRPAVDRLDGRWLPAVVPLAPAQLIQAYGINSVSITGAGQTIAIVDAFHDPYIASDLATFDQVAGLPGQTVSQLASTLTVVNLAGNSVDSGWAGEETLDVEWVHAVAPGAKIIVVEAASDSLTDLMNAVNVARNIAGVSVVSMSWGASEFRGETAYDSYFTTPAGHTPITFVAATGDDGAGAEWPASSPNVVAVGGTTLSITGTASIQSESAWSGSGGGISLYESEPSYQRTVQSTGRRTTPDVSMDADPNSGLYTYTTDPQTGRGSWGVVGGTSASAQLFAGVLAISDQVRAIFGKGTLDTASVLSTLYANPSILNDITSGSNGYAARAGYDLATGLGTPKAFSLYVALYQPGVVTTVSASAAATSSTTATAHAVVATAVTTTATSSSTVSSTLVATPASSTEATVVSTVSGISGSHATAGDSAVLSNAVPQALSRSYPISTLPQSSGLTASPAEAAEGSTAEGSATATRMRRPGRDGAERIEDIDRASDRNSWPVMPTTGEGAERPAEVPPAPPTSSEDDPSRNEGGAEQVSVIGLVTIALGATAWQSRALPRLATPGGPRNLFLNKSSEDDFLRVRRVRRA